MKNSRNKLALLFFLFSMVSMAQVGIGTPAPAATLDVTAANLTGTTVDGLLIPRVSRLRAQTMTGTPTSTVLYVNDISTGTATGTTINVTAVGFYFFNGTVWERLGSGATAGWLTTGNSGLSGTTNFLGTTDGVDLAFRRNNSAAGKIGATSTSFGVNALSAGVATNNVAMGTNALAASTGADNVAVGNGALTANTTTIQNTAVGNAALALNTGSANTAVGFQALNRNTASNNTGLGFQALATATTAVNNTAVGFQAGALLTSSRNTTVGFQALGAAAGNENTAIGNLALGRTTGSGNTAIGHEAEFGSGTAFNNTTAIGWHALFNNSGSGNTAVGYNALQGNGTAIGNTAVGLSALRIATGANNTALGTLAGDEIQTGTNNTYIGFEAGRYNTFAANNNTFLGYQSGHFSQGSFNVALGSNTLKGNGATSNNVAVGYNALNAGLTATNNTALGYGALSGNAAGTANVAVGYNAGAAETGSNKLYIENSNANSSNALIYGEFDTNIARVNGTLQINNPANPNGYALPNVRGTNGQVLQTNGAGATSWTTPAAVVETDPQVSSATTNAVPRWNGTTLVDGVMSDDATNVGIGAAPTAGNRLDVNGNTRTTNFQMTSGASADYILQSDAVGNGTWVQNPLNNLSMVRANLSANQTLTAGGWQIVNFNNEAFDTANEFNPATNRFTATKAGFYRIDAAFHTNDQSNGNLYSIGISVNGTFEQLTSSDHHGVGIVERSVTCLVQLAVGDFVEVFAENFVSGVDLDGYSGKTVLEIQQVR